MIDHVDLPKFDFKTDYDLIAALHALRINDAFGGNANFSGIDEKIENGEL